MTSGSDIRLRDISLGPARVAALRKGGALHKYDHGHALILSGGAGRSGAARLAARAALRIGAGLVTIGVPGDGLAEVAAQVTAVMVRVADTPAEVLADKRINAVCIGPGFGAGAACRSAVREVLNSGRAAVLDADALTSFSDDPAELFDLTRGQDVVLTPHAGEFARLFPGIAVDRVGVSQAAVLAGCTVMLKGAETCVARVDGTVALHNADGQRGAPWLATAGSGDVLAGMIVGLMARGFEPDEAADCTVWLHAECARQFGPGLIAEDLTEALPGVFRALGV